MIVESMVGKVFHFVSVDENGEEVADKGSFINTRMIGEDVYYIMKIVGTGEEVYIKPEMITSLY